MKSLVCKSICFLLCITLPSLVIHCGWKTAGSEVINEAVLGNATVYMPDGKTPANEAIVQIVPVDYVPGKETDQIYIDTTDTIGEYTFSGIKEGIYNIIARKDSLICLLDSIHIEKESEIPNDTLENAGSLTAWVKLQPNHSPRTVIVQVIGTTEYYSNVDSTGQFTIKDIAAGFYQLRLETSQSLGYTATIASVRIRTGMNDTLFDPIELIYNGIPVVTGLKAEYDSRKSIITVKWDSIQYSDFYDYAVYRDNSDSSELSGSPLTFVDKPVFYDTIGNKQIDTPSIVSFMYRVAVRNKSLQRGETYKFIKISAIVGKSNGLLFPKDTATFIPNEPCLLKILPDPVLGEVSKYYWAIGAGSQFKEVSAPETSIVIDIPQDSICTYLCIAKVITEDGIELLDTIYLQSRFEWKKISELPFNNSSGLYSIPFKGLIYLFNSEQIADDTVWSIWKSLDGISWEIIVDSLPFKLQKKPVVFKDKLWIFERNTDSAFAAIWNSDDGAVWNSQSLNNIPNSLYSNQYEVWSTWGDRLVIVNYFPMCYADNSCENKVINSWESSNGVDWDVLQTNKSIFPDRGDKPNTNFIACELNNKLYIGGAWRALGLKNPSWAAYGFRIWTDAQAEPMQINFPVPVDTNAFFDNLMPEIAVFKGKLFITSSVDTRYMWVLMPDNRWTVCTDSYPGGQISQNYKNYHSLCVHDDNLFSISNSGVWVISR